MAYNPLGEISEVRGIGDIDSAVAVQTINIDQTGAGSVTVYTPPANKIFLLYALLLENRSGATVKAVLKSGATAIGTSKLLQTNGSLLLDNLGMPWLVGRVAAEAFVVTVDGDCNGFAVVGYRDA